MNLLTRLFARSPDPRERLRPLWHALVAQSRDPVWYAELGVADTLAGRFDMVSAITALALLRLESDPAHAPDTALLTELFVEDMDGQLRESGVGDLVVGKHVGKLVGSLGGRLGAYREALAQKDDAALAEAVSRNITLLDGADPLPLARALRETHRRFAALDAESFVSGPSA